ncbi:alpha/beta fold hydrolase [Streptomyces sp. DT193]|uniref:esterase/lipase family protein n=1 Tax=Streptomyces sp. DT193 TaxID=3393418 RepID=UPI003CE7797C
MCEKDVSPDGRATRSGDSQEDSDRRRARQVTQPFHAASPRGSDWILEAQQCASVRLNAPCHGNGGWSDMWASVSSLAAPWVTDRSHEVLGVVFVHGFNSSPSMWDGFARLMAADGDLAELRVLPFEYTTMLLRRRRRLRVIPTLDAVADSLKEFLRTDAESCDDLVLVGHSMGGLVIQRYLARMLAEGQGHELGRIKRAVLLATPNAGSLLLLSARRVLLRGNPQEEELRPLNEQITDTLRRVLADVVNATEMSEHTCPIPFSVFAGEEDGVVPRASAQLVFPDVGALPGDHFSIAWPDSHEHRTYTTVKRLLLLATTDSVPPTDTVAMLSAAVLEVHNAAAPNQELPELGIPLTEYLCREHDRKLRELLEPVLAGGPSRLVILTGVAAKLSTSVVCR